MSVFTDQKDKWSAHLEYLKTVVTLTVATIAAVVAIYADPAKLPVDISRYPLMGFAAAALLSLAFALFALAGIANIVAGAVTKTKPVTIPAELSFILLFISMGALLVFLYMRSGSVTAEQRAIDVERNVVEKSSRTSNELVSLTNFTATANKYYMVFQLTPGSKSIAVTIDAKTNSVLSLEPKP